MQRIRILRDQRGVELIEFAIVSMVFFTLIFGGLDFGRLIWQRNVVANAAKEGARWAAVRGATSASPASCSELQSYVQSLAFEVAVTVTTDGCPSTKVRGSVMTVVVRGTFTPVVSFLPLAATTLRSSAQMVVAR